MANQSTEILLKSVKLRRHLFLWRIIQRNYTECLHLLLLLSERNRDSTIQNNKLLFPYFSVKIDLLEKKCKSAYIFLGNMSWIKVSFCTPSTNLLHIAFRVRKLNLYLVSCCWEIITKTFSVHLCSCCNVWVSSISRKKNCKSPVWLLIVWLRSVLYVRQQMIWELNFQKLSYVSEKDIAYICSKSPYCQRLIAAVIKKRAGSRRNNSFI